VGFPSGSLYAVADQPSKLSINLRVAAFTFGAPLLQPLGAGFVGGGEEDFLVQHWMLSGPGQWPAVLV
jgi:hypothetical protein